MSSSSPNSISSSEWKALTLLAESTANDSVVGYFAQDPERLEQYSIDLPGLYLDFSKNRVNNDVLKTLVQLAEGSGLQAKRTAMFRGESINITEQQPVLHTALRSQGAHLAVSVEATTNQITSQLQNMRRCSEAIRSGSWTGSTGKAITDVVNIGIGGSELGPRMVCRALREYAKPGISIHFLSNVDGAEIDALLADLDPATTLFIVCSKTFSTQETLLNASAATRWLGDHLELEKPASHLIAITAVPEAAAEFGVDPENVLPLNQWICGRYSLWSAVGLSISISIGQDRFENLLQGAKAMDDHFLNAPLAQNMPVILALMGIWYNNFLGAQSIAIIPYCERLGLLPSFLRQLDMESNGKSITASGTKVDDTTAPVVWGETGTNGQHAFFQLLHQGTKLIPVDLIGTIKENLGDSYQHRVLLGNMFAQAAALMNGDQGVDPHLTYPGNKPSNTCCLTN